MQKVVSSHLAQQVNYKSHDFHMRSNFWKENRKTLYHNAHMPKTKKINTICAVFYTVYNIKIRNKLQNMWKVGIYCGMSEMFLLWSQGIFNLTFTGHARSSWLCATVEYRWTVKPQG
jgi:hypothetical protein